MNFPACQHCIRAKEARLCEKDKSGGACVACKKHKYKCEYANTRIPVDEDDNVEVVEGPSKLKKKSAAVTRARVKKDKAPKTTGAKRVREEDDDDNDNDDDDDDDVAVDPPAKGKKKAAGGSVRVKREKEPPKKSKAPKKTKGKAWVGGKGRDRMAESGGDDEDEDAEGELESGVEEPKSKRARVQVGPPRGKGMIFLSQKILFNHSYLRHGPIRCPAHGA